MALDKNTVLAKTNAKEIVLACVKALNAEDFTAARKHVSDDFTFEGVLGSRNGAEDYFKDMSKMKLKYDVKKSFVDGDDVCLFYDLAMSGLTIFGCGWYRVGGDKIKSLKVVFDPRPVLEQSGKK